MTNKTVLSAVVVAGLAAVALLTFAAGCLVGLDGQNGGHLHLLAAGSVHLLADYAFDVLEDAPGEGEVGVDAGGDLVDEAGAQEEAVGWGLRLRRVLAQRLSEEL